MKKFLLAAAAIGALAMPQSAGAVAIASADLFTNGLATITITSGGISSVTSLLTSNNSANSAPPPLGVNVLATSNTIPGTADAAAAMQGNARGDSVISFNFAGLGGTLSFNTGADGAPTAGRAESALGEVTSAFGFSRGGGGDYNLIVTIPFQRVFSLTTDMMGDVAAFRTSLSAGLVRGPNIIVPTITLSNAACNPNTALSIADGAALSDSCTGTITFTFTNPGNGSANLTIGASSGIDARSAAAVVPAPAALGLFGLGLFGLGLARRKAA